MLEKSLNQINFSLSSKEIFQDYQTLGKECETLSPTSQNDSHTLAPTLNFSRNGNTINTREIS